MIPFEFIYSIKASFLFLKNVSYYCFVLIFINIKADLKCKVINLVDHKSRCVVTCLLDVLYKLLFEIRASKG